MALIPRRYTPYLGLLVVSAAAAAWYLFTRPPSARPDQADERVTDPPAPDPRVVFPTPYRNVKPGVAYVGDAACAGCHPGIVETYHAHPMGRSAEFVGRASPVERYDAAAHPSFTTGAFELRAERTAGGMAHRVRAGTPPLDYAAAPGLAVGSGTRGRSYLTIESGAVWQTPISWFTAAGRWDLSPGFDLAAAGRRAIQPECLFCHVDRVEPVPGATNRYREPLVPGRAAIGCERCHGPGELHAAERAGTRPAASPDTSIVNPKHLPPELRAGVCAQCHLQGQERVTRRGRSAFDFRPGLPWEQFVAVFVPHPSLAEAHQSVGQFEQMARSRCSAGSGGRLGCTSCHDPHQVPSAVTRDQFYRDRCLTCHESHGCLLPAPERAARGDSCVACHMPQTGSSNVAHASVTDHRIPRRPGADPAPVGLPPGAVHLIPFPTGPRGPAAAEESRDLGIALGRVASKVPASSPVTRGLLGRLGADRLASWLRTCPGDADGWAGLAVARLATGNADGAYDAASVAVATAPESEANWAGLADAAAFAGRLDRAVEAASKVIQMNPAAVDQLVVRAAAYARQREWEKAERDCRAALRIYPLHQRARLVLAVCLHHRGDPAGGRKEAETAAGFSSDPRQRSAVLEMYRQAIR